MSKTSSDAHVQHDEEEDHVHVEPLTLVLPLDVETLMWLAEMADGCDVRAAQIVAGMLRDIRVDDEAAHRTRH